VGSRGRLAGGDFHPGEDSDGAAKGKDGSREGGREGRRDGGEGPRVGREGGDAARVESRGGAGGVAGVPWREAGPPNHLDDKVGYVSASGADSDSSRVGQSRPPRAAGSGGIRGMVSNRAGAAGAAQAHNLQSDPSYTGLYPQTGGDVHPGEESSDGASRVGQFEQSRLEVPAARQEPLTLLLSSLLLSSL